MNEEVIKITICDDVEQHRDGCQRMLQYLGAKHKVQLEFVQFEHGDQMLLRMDDPKKAADILYLDVRMPGTNGIVAAEKLRQTGFVGEIIFLTASQKDFLGAFDVGAMNYLIKGICSDERFEQVFLSAVKKVQEKRKDYIMFTGAGESRAISLNSIHYFEIFKRIITVFYKDSSFEFYSSMSRLENMLLPYGFIRVHRSYLVSVYYVDSLQYDKLTLRDGTEIPVGQSFYRNVKSSLLNRSLATDEMDGIRE